MYTCGNCGREMDESYYGMRSKIMGYMHLCEKCIELPVLYYIEKERTYVVPEALSEFNPYLEFDAGGDNDPFESERILEKFKKR